MASSQNGGSAPASSKALNTASLQCSKHCSTAVRPPNDASGEAPWASSQRAAAAARAGGARSCGRLQRGGPAESSPCNGASTSRPLKPAASARLMASSQSSSPSPATRIAKSSRPKDGIWSIFSCTPTTPNATTPQSANTAWSSLSSLPSQQSCWNAAGKASHESSAQACSWIRAFSAATESNGEAMTIANCVQSPVLMAISNVMSSVTGPSTRPRAFSAHSAHHSRKLLYWMGPPLRPSKAVSSSSVELWSKRSGPRVLSKSSNTLRSM
mmetsp:Transcript_134742/g.430529  ORF Transcript_134742/g.430529 Transcript_134742/m.430529 type:complete len:270 (+) Transcript_134742:1678-2487(+)